MGRLKDFFHDEVVARAEEDLDAYPFSPDTCFVLSEHDTLTGETKPLHAYTFRADAEEALRLFALGQKTFQIPEYLDYTIAEVRTS